MMWHSPRVAQHTGSSWNIYNTSNSDLVSNNVTAIEVDSDGTVWAGFSSAGLFSSLNTYIMSLEGSSWSAFGTSSLSLSFNGVTDIQSDHNGDLWISTDGGLIYYDH